MIAVLSPAKSLEFDFAVDGLECTTPELLDKADYLAHKLKPYSAKRIAKLMGVSEQLSVLNYERYQQWEVPHNDEARPCMLAFRGEVYRGLKAEDMNEEDLDFAQGHVRILSGLYGVLKPMDKILPYRLEMGTSLKVTASKSNLYKYWGDTIVDTINDAMKESGSDVLVNLASNEYFKSIKTDKLNGRLVTCLFKDNKNGEFKVLMTYAKHARGAMARYIITNRLNSPDDLKGFDWEGYSFNDKLSSEDEFVFTR